MGRMGDAWDVAYAALFLASEEAKYITGTELVVDGGLTVNCVYKRQLEPGHLPGVSYRGCSPSYTGHATGGGAADPGNYLGLPSFVTLLPMLSSPHNENGFPGLGRWTPEREDRR